MNQMIHDTDTRKKKTTHGKAVGFKLGKLVGKSVGISVGYHVGYSVGVFVVGRGVGRRVGLLVVGRGVGVPLGDGDATSLGFVLATSLGFGMGDAAGSKAGAFVVVKNSCVSNAALPSSTFAAAAGSRVASFGVVGTTVGATVGFDDPPSSKESSGVDVIAPSRSWWRTMATIAKARTIVAMTVVANFWRENSILASYYGLADVFRLYRSALARQGIEDVLTLLGE
jgi:hypothetical protein